MSPWRRRLKTGWGEVSWRLLRRSLRSLERSFMESLPVSCANGREGNVSCANGREGKKRRIAQGASIIWAFRFVHNLFERFWFFKKSRKIWDISEDENLVRTRNFYSKGLNPFHQFKIKVYDKFKIRVGIKSNGPSNPELNMYSLNLLKICFCRNFESKIRNNL